MTHQTDLNLAAKDISRLTSAEAVAGFLSSLGYDTGRRKPLTPEAIGLAGEAAAAIQSLEVLAEDADGDLRVVFVQLRSLTAKSRNDLARVLGRTNVEHLLVLTSNFDTLEFVLLAKRRRDRRNLEEIRGFQAVPLTLAVDRKAVGTKELRAIRRFTWTCRDGLEQFDKLRSVFEAAAFSEEYFCNRALFADHFLITRLREDPAWRDNPAPAFQRVKAMMQDARQRWLGKGEQIVRQELYEPLFELLGFKAKVNKVSGQAHTAPDYLLSAPEGKTAAFVYTWDRWLDGPDFNLDHETSEENPGACVVTALDEGVADWIIVTNGRQWRLYSRHAHSRATNFYEVDLAEALVASGDTDPNEAFRYWWLFFRAQAFSPCGAGVPPARAAAETAAPQGCWLDAVSQGSRDYAKEIGERLKHRIFVEIFPHLAHGFLEDRKRRLGTGRQPSEEERTDIYEATLTLLYRLLFLLYAESRDLLPIREAPYREASLRKIKEEIAQKAGIAESEAADRLAKAYSPTETSLYDRLVRLCEAMDRGEPSLNVPEYNGGLFVTRPGDSDDREQRIARFLRDHKVPDRYLAPAIDRLARDPDDKTFSLVFIDYKSLEVRHLGSIYEGLLEFKLRIAEEDLTTKTEDKREKYIPLSAAKPGRGRTPEAVVRKGQVYLSNDKAERKASGSYYTPDPIVEYIVEQTVGPVLAEKLEKLRPALRKVRKTFDREMANVSDPRIHQHPPAAARGAAGDGGVVAQASRLPETEGQDSMAEKQAGRLHHKARNLRQEAADKTYDAHRDLVEALFDLRALDPAMGSGHFLVEAVDFITDRLLTFLNQFPVNPVTFMLDRTRRNILEALGERGVAVDPDKLTEVNLLKRHVLKRCIYGVDLNPMAVELAKVSLWLDAFTIGAPLSFLDHHLRCGNSLIGATFKDLEAATKGQLFSIDYERLVRAIRHVIQVNQMADATAAEVKQSAGEYTAARSDLLGYQIVLDLLVAQHFGMPDAPEVLRMGADLDLSSREQFAASVAALGVGNAEKRKREKKKDLSPTLVADVEALARRPDLDFFHWEIEFPEVFFGFEDAEQRRIRHKNEMVAGTAGFDAVVGNPPYVRVELAEKDCKSYLKAHYRTVVDRCDIYVAFIELAMRALRSDGLAGLIVSNQFFNTDYGKNTRELFSEKRSLRNLVDISPLQIFGGALTYPAVLIFALQPQETIRVLAMERFASSTAATLRHDTIFAAYSSRHTEVASHDLYCRDVWNASAICDSGTRDLEDAAGLVPLGSICNISSSMKSGRDDVLVGRIVRETADQFEIEIPIRESPLCVSARLWRRVIRPRDIEVEGRLTNSPSRVVFWPYRDLPDDSFDLMGESELRSICKTTFAHIQQHRELLENRRDSGKTWKQHGRPWYTLGRIGKPSDYEPVKLLSPGEFKTPRFAVSNDRSLFPCARIIGISRIKVAPLALKVFLESGVAADWFRANLAPKGGGFRGMSVGNLSKLPTPRTTDLIWQELAEATGQQAVEEVIANWLAKSHS